MTPTTGHFEHQRGPSNRRRTGFSALRLPHTFNLAGLPLTDVDPGGYTTRYDYSTIGSGKVTKTMPDLGNSITQNYLDGTLQSESGTAVVPKYYVYSIQNLNGSLVLGDNSTVGAGTPRTVISAGSATAQTSRKTTTDVDWMGHAVTEDTANPSSVGGDLISTYQYNNLGQLVQTTTGGLAPVLNQYDSFGQLFRSGIKLADTNSPNALDTASSDRISEQTTSFYKDPNGVWWELTANYAYPTVNSSAQLMVREILKQQSGWYRTSLANYFSGSYYSLVPHNYTKTFDASGNWTYTGDLCDRTQGLNYTEKDSSLTGGNSVLLGGPGWSSKTFRF